MPAASPEMWSDAIARARAHAPHLAQALDRQPDLAALLAAGRGEGALAFAHAAGASEPVAVMLRRRKRALALALAIGDLAGAFPLARVVGELSAFADYALDAAIGAGIRHRVPDAPTTGFFALALGKHGAGELNYSSDIDPILVFDPERLPRRPRDEPGEAAQRVARRVVETMAAQTADGYVFRIDLRLRPASEVSPLAIPLGAALTHYEGSALAWERAAFVRARAAAGDIAAGAAFLHAIGSFVWRRSLDFGAIEEIGRLTARIRDAHGGPLAPGPGFDLKRGRGGIREIEFFVQAHQLIHGGRDPSLRVRGTREGLDTLAAAGRILPADARIMGTAYDRLRTLEHRLQMVDDRQTHALPDTPAGIDTIAALDGIAGGGAALIAELETLTLAVGTRFDALIAPYSHGPRTIAVGAPRTPARLAGLGFAEPEALARRIARWGDGSVRALRSDAARAAFERMAPALFEALAAAPDPPAALIRWERLITNLPSAVNLFRLLEARPGLLAQLADILALAPPLADELGRRPVLLDALIDASAFDLPGSVADLAGAIVAPQAVRAGGYEARLDAVRRVVGDQRFALGVQLIGGRRDPLEAGAALSRLAEAALGVCADAAQAEFARSHGPGPGPGPGGGLVVLGLGRLGGGMLTHASDLDLVYLFDAPLGAESTGPRPLGATLYYNRLAARITAALSVPTAEGALYDVDTRLRPQGDKGPLAVSLDSFARYQCEYAWTWEHMALTRARVLHGSPPARAKVDAIVARVLALPRDADALRADVLAMRAQMAAHKPARGVLDAKLARGGLVDAEFLVHFAQLRTGIGLSPRLDEAIAALADAGLVPAGLGAERDWMTRLLIAARLFAPDGHLPAPAAQAALARACRVADMAELEARFRACRAVVAQGWARAFGEPLEGI